jgi:hypothetical protein
MLQIVITGAIILLFLKLADKENVMDLFGSATLYLAPLAFVIIANWLISYFQLHMVSVFIVHLVYLIIPYLILNAIYENYSAKKKLLLSGGILTIVTFTEILQAVLVSSLVS